MALTLHLYSFGYHFSGVPTDPTGNGGGFVFDCRCLPNPGRFTEYQRLTGLDVQVCDFLDEASEVQEFAQQCLQLVQLAIRQYQQRGFTDLMVAFGCTGGQHRSVYQAEKLRSRLVHIPDLHIELIHTERENWPY